MYIYIYIYISLCIYIYKLGSNEAMKNFVAGGVGGVCAVIVGHPFDLVKVDISEGWQLIIH